jgi:hypothetical protein
LISVASSSSKDGPTPASICTPPSMGEICGAA